MTIECIRRRTSSHAENTTQPRNRHRTVHITYTGCITQISDISKCNFNVKSLDHRDATPSVLRFPCSERCVLRVLLTGFTTNILLMRIYLHKNNNNEQVLFSRQSFLSLMNAKRNNII